MKYFKLIKGTEFIGVTSENEFLKHQIKHNILLMCKADEGQYVGVNDRLYRDNWMSPVTTDLEYETCDVVEIKEDEYHALFEAMASNEEIIVEQPQISEEPMPELEPIETTTVEYVKASKIAEMSRCCNHIIENGVDVILSDGKSYHFSLTTQDQLNLITLASLVASGATQIPYHADGELCRYYSADDISTIITTATQFKTYHITYFNSLKAYIASLTDNIAEISSVEYGVEIPAEYQSDILKNLISKGATK